jgi:hypothetical protein
MTSFPLGPPSSVRASPSAVTTETVLWLLAAGAAFAFSDSLLPTVAIGALWVIWRLLREPDMPPVFAFAASYQWLQVSISLFYYQFSGRTHWMWTDVDARPWILVSLAGVVSLACGIWFARRSRPVYVPGGERRLPFSLTGLAGIYFALLFGSFALVQAAQIFPVLYGLYQGIVMFSLSRLAVLYVLFRRLLRPPARWLPFAALIAWEVVFGFTGYFGGFKEALIVALLAVTARFDRHRVSHWVSVISVTLVLGVASVTWTAIKPEYRAAIDEDPNRLATRSARFEEARGLARIWFRNPGDILETIDYTVNRIGAVYFPALAFARVPRFEPHTGGTFFLHAFQHVLTPRLFFPDKGALIGDSEKVRRYAGVYVAGEESGTSIAFGYMPEMYVDFGVPLMFAPCFLLGWLIGRIANWFERRVRHRELLVGFLAYSCWIALYLYERSWDKMIGQSLTTFLYVGGLVLLADRALLAVDSRRREQGAVGGSTGLSR